MGIVAGKNNFVRRKFAVLIALVAIILVSGIIAVGAFERGPFVCNNDCLVQSPLIDTKTKQFIDQNLAPADNYIPMWAYATGTTYMICNALFCTTYHQTFSGEWVGEGRVKIENDNGGGNGGGGPGPGGGDFGDLGGPTCDVVTRWGTGCVDTGGGPKCESMSYQTIECW